MPPRLGKICSLVARRPCALRGGGRRCSYGDGAAAGPPCSGCGGWWRWAFSTWTDVARFLREAPPYVRVRLVAAPPRASQRHDGWRLGPLAVGSCVGTFFTLSRLFRMRRAGLRRVRLLALQRFTNDPTGAGLVSARACEFSFRARFADAGASVGPRITRRFRGPSQVTCVLTFFGPSAPLTYCLVTRSTWLRGDRAVGSGQAFYLFVSLLERVPPHDTGIGPPCLGATAREPFPRRFVVSFSARRFLGRPPWRPLSSRGRGRAVPGLVVVRMAPSFRGLFTVPDPAGCPWFYWAAPAPIGACPRVDSDDSAAGPISSANVLRSRAPGARG